MCLHCYDEECFEHTALVDIPVVKVMVERRNIFGRVVYEAPIMRRRVSRRVIRGKRRYVASGKEDVFKTGAFFGYATIDGGFIHTFGMSGLHSGYLFPALRDGERYVVFRCVIPKGERYWMSSAVDQYASKSIRFEEIIDDGYEVGVDVGYDLSHYSVKVKK